MILRALETMDLPTVLAWRNHPDIRRYMFSQHEISQSEHLAWYERGRDDPSRIFLIAESEEEPFGYVSFSLDSSLSVGTWGFYVRPGAPAGSGVKLCSAALDYAFEQAGLNKVFDKTLSYNQRAINLHLKLGFKEEGILRSHFFDGVAHHDIHCFGILRPEWKKLRENPCPL